MNTLDEIRLAAEGDLETFIRLIAPEQVLGAVHLEVLSWWTREDAKNNQLLLLPRDHGKSRLVAFRVAWELTKDPTLRVLYISSTANLAEKQLSFIKNIFTSKIHRRYWPDHVEEDEGKRRKWTTSEIELDHPARLLENIRDPSIFTAGLTTGITGLHCDIAVLDDVVVQENADTKEGRNKVESQYSLLASIEGADAREWAVGTRYHPLDLYNTLMAAEEEVFDDDGVQAGTDKIYEVFERKVEDRGDGTGEFLWPRQRREDGKWFGFDQRILAQKRGKYTDRGKYRAQYYNNPTDPDNVPIPREKFQYYERKFLTRDGGKWYYKDERLNVYAAIDFAFSLSKKSDWTAIVVIGIDSSNRVFILDIERFKTDRIKIYFQKLMELMSKWDFRKIRAEVTVAQQVIVKQLKEEVWASGRPLSIDEYRPNKREGAKAERIEAELQPRYDNGQMYHYRGGETTTLEDELLTNNPPHDDVKDALASVLGIAIRPASRSKGVKKSPLNLINRFRGG